MPAPTALSEQFQRTFQKYFVGKRKPTDRVLYISPLLRVDETSKGRAYVAARPIPAGALLIREIPFSCLHEEQVYAAYILSCRLANSIHVACNWLYLEGGASAEDTFQWRYFS
jgi:hypothetical protein